MDVATKEDGLSAEAREWLQVLSPELARDIAGMESVESWRVDLVPGPWSALFRFLVREREAGALDRADMSALLNYLAYIGSSNALFVMQRITQYPDEALDSLIEHAAARDLAMPDGDPLAQVTLARMRHLFTRRLFTRIFCPERRAEVLDILRAHAARAANEGGTDNEAI